MAVELAEFIDQLRAELTKAMDASEDADLRFELGPVELELTVAGEQSPLRMKGCGLVVINPPWQFEGAAKPGRAGRAKRHTLRLVDPRTPRVVENL